jgi:hypothetical protein
MLNLLVLELTADELEAVESMNKALDREAFGKT